ncbi:sugar transferase [Halomonas maura]|nr:sugar transferase [Halomonas maura]MDN3554763.1 sugar transferase [Halomonas maura]
MIIVNCTMRPPTVRIMTVTAGNDTRNTPLCRFFRSLWLNEPPQLIIVLLGQMSPAGLRPDMPGFAGWLEREQRAVLGLRRVITGPAMLAYRNGSRG